jgi:TfoX/Sxy family transcriptional regulator of competence genes
MAYDESLAERIRGMLGDRPVEEKRMFGGLAFLVGGHMSVSASGKGGLLVRFDPAETEALRGEPGAEEFAMGGRGPMDGWLRVRPDVLDDDAVLQRWVDRGVRFAESLPPQD